MPQTLKFTVLNSQIVTLDAAMTTPEGEDYIAQFKRTTLEALPADQLGKTFSAVLPADAAAEFPEGTVITVTINAEVPAQQEA
ncbi:hypothetical protein [Sphingomonas sp. GC_Shp_3]|uniref:hypothetical protein n=1 Tax=Sphingomonas sp. GC_Shp_3 TaxID=2937383 RepID=UPI00226A1C8A|nr:hypothetical protein [Sphingomonas sp. GC_Shp_3]